MPISTFNGFIANQTTTLVNARELHQRLQVKRDFSTWIKDRIEQYHFIENEDFIRSPNLGSGKPLSFFGGNNRTDYHLTLDMAKELCMLERSELGRQARRYFIEQEKQAKQLAAQNAKLLAAIPPFLLNNPDQTTALVQQAQQAFLTLHPEAKAIVRYRDMGLTNPEICKLLNLTKMMLERRLAKMFELGLAERKTQNQYTQQSQLPLGLPA